MESTSNQLIAEVLFGERTLPVSGHRTLSTLECKLAARLVFCPKCKVEYRPGFARCSDCEVDLVHVLPEENLSSDETLTSLWECADQTECLGVCEDLRSADISYHVDEVPCEKTAEMGVKWCYRVLVSPDDFDRAKELLGIEAPQNTIPTSEAEDEEVVDPTVELPDAGTPLTDDSKRRDTYLGPWYREDATVEVWSQDGDDLSVGIARALDANYIHCRCDSDESGAKKIFVRPEDESFTREIVREIIEGTPLE
jgi:hypothetical protein